MSDAPAISFVIPVYNPPAEKLRACMRSLRSQTYKDFEVVIVDDGSDDGIRELLEEIQDSLTDISVHLFLRPHEGVSAARNYGALQATGAYVSFIDCDDEIPQYVTERICGLVEKFDSPDLILGYVQFIKKEEDKEHREGDDVVVGSEKLVSELYRYHLSGNGREFTTELDRDTKLKIGPVARFAKTEIVRSCLFPSSVRIGEDVLWSLDLLRKVQSVVIIDGILYWYWRDHLSTTLRYRDDAYENAFSFFTALPEYLDADIGMREEDVTLRVLGEVNRVVRTSFVHDEANLSSSEKKGIVKRLLNHQSIRKYVTLPKILKAGPMALAKYALLKTGFAEAYWKRSGSN